MYAYFMIPDLNESSRLKKERELVEKFVEDGGNVLDLHSAEEVLIDTGSLSDSYELIVSSNTLVNVQELKKRIVVCFHSALSKVYDEPKDISDAIDFDDVVLSERMPIILNEMISQLKLVGNVEKVQKKYPYFEYEIYKLTL